MKKTKKEILQMTRQLVKDLKWLEENAKNEQLDYSTDPFSRDYALGREIAYGLAWKWLEEIVGKDKEEG